MTIEQPDTIPVIKLPPRPKGRQVFTRVVMLVAGNWTVAAEARIYRRWLFWFQIMLVVIATERKK